MKYKYDPQTFESKWQEKWFSEMKYTAQDFLLDKPKYYLLVEFPYPSGPGMHMGHLRNDSMMDAVARFKRMKGFNVMYPIGWDAFGLPTESYAIKVKRPPKEISYENIQNFRRQLKSLGLSFDWEREVDTSDPQYYKWTQWIFLKLFEKGLAYKSELPVNWCPNCKVVCANEEVIDSCHERCNTLVERKSMNQWVLKITEYADRLDKDLDNVNFSDSVKALQRNWIGKKDWYDIEYKVEDSDIFLRVSTTRPDTQFGASFVVIAPEHEIVEKLLQKISDDKKKEIRQYVSMSLQRSELERISEEKGKSGVFTGIYCINSITGERLPIYIADFVLASVGTGIVVGVPAHDKRDFEFAIKFGLPVKRVIEGPNGDRSSIDSLDKVYVQEGKLFNSQFLNGLDSEEARIKVGEYIKEKGIGDTVTRYHLRDWIFSRQHYWGEPIPIIHCPNCGMVALEEKDLPLELPEVEAYEPTDTGESPLANISEWVNTKCPKCGADAKRETDTMPNWAGSSWYFLRYCDPHNSKEFTNRELSDYWMQVDHYEGGQEHITLHLLYSRFWHKFLYDLGYVRDSEPYASRSIHGLVIGEDGNKMSKSLGNIVSPDDLVAKYGADITRGYAMFMGPYEGNVEWSTRTLEGVRRFVLKYYDFLLKGWDERVEESDMSVKTSINKLVYKIERDIEDFKFNTAIAALMKFYNAQNDKKVDKEDITKLLIVSSPIFPHLTEEIWSKTIGPISSVHEQSWPVVDQTTLVEDTVEIPVQIQGKVRGRIFVSVNDNEEDIKKKILEDNTLSTWLLNKKIKKVIYIPNRIVSVLL